MPSYILRKDVRKLPGQVIKGVPKPKPFIFEGYQTRKKVAEICIKQNFNKCLIVTDSTLFKLKYHELITKELDKHHIEYKVFSNIASEPTVDIITEGKKIALDFKADVIVALGGGSVMDSCKIISASVKLDKLSVKTLLQKFLVVNGKTLPIITIPSTAGTGAEITVGAVVTSKNKLVKQSTVIVGLNIIDVILDSELSLNLPFNITAACGIDALSHGLEGILSDVRVSRLDMQKSFECVKLVLNNLPKVLNKPNDKNARLNMAKAALYGGYAINNQLAGYVHAFAHSIGALYHIPHGQAIALSLLPVLDFNKEKCKDKLAELAIYCQLAQPIDSVEYARDQICDRIEELIISTNLLDKSNCIKTKDYNKLVKMIATDSINYSAPIILKNSDIKLLLKQISKQ